MEIEQPAPFQDKPQGRVRQAAARCWAMLLARIYECLLLTCPKCSQPMRLIAFIMEHMTPSELVVAYVLRDQLHGFFGGLRKIQKMKKIPDDYHINQEVKLWSEVA